MNNKILWGWWMLAMLLQGLSGAAQAPTWQTAIAISNSNSDYSTVQALVADGGDNLYLVGNFRGTITLGTTSLTNTGNQLGTFVAKWNAASQAFVWAERATTTGTAITLVRSGTSLYVAATGTLIKVMDNGNSGSIAWAQTVPGLSALAVSGTALYVAGTFGAPISLGPFALTNSLPNTGIAPFGSNDLYVAKLVDNGSNVAFTWVQSAAGQLSRYGTPVQLAASGSALYVAGNIAAATTFGSSQLAPGGVAASQAFVAKLLDAGTNGSFNWVQAVGGTGQAQPLSLLARGTDLYLSGIYFGATATFGSVALANAGTGTVPDGDAFVAKLTDTGTSLAPDWALRAGGTGRDSASTLLVVGSTLYVGGKFGGNSADFGPITLTSNQAYSRPLTNLFVAQIRESATGAAFTWALSTQNAGSFGYNATTALAQVGATVYAAGFIGPTTTFGTTTLVNQSSIYTGYLASLTGQTLATRSPELQAALALYPNPAHGAATVRVPAGAEPVALTLLDALGRVVRTYVAPAGQDHAFGLAGLAPGIYTLRVQAGDGVATQRLAVE